MRALVVTKVSAGIQPKTSLVRDHRVVPRLEARSQCSGIGGIGSQTGNGIRIHLKHPWRRARPR
jgi:hypothetical protein